jgi:hypothetical protein
MSAVVGAALCRFTAVLPPGAQSFTTWMDAALIVPRLILASLESLQDAVVESAAILGGERSTWRVYPPRLNLRPFHRCDIDASRLPSVEGSIKCFSRVE